MAIHELKRDALTQTGEQCRSSSGQDWLHEELVLVASTMLNFQDIEAMLDRLRRAPAVTSPVAPLAADPAARLPRLQRPSEARKTLRRNMTERADVHRVQSPTTEDQRRKGASDLSEAPIPTMASWRAPSWA